MKHLLERRHIILLEFLQLQKYSLYRQHIKPTTDLLSLMFVTTQLVNHQSVTANKFLPECFVLFFLIRKTELLLRKSLWSVVTVTGLPKLFCIFTYTCAMYVSQDVCNV